MTKGKCINLKSLEQVKELRKFVSQVKNRICTSSEDRKLLKSDKGDGKKGYKEGVQ